MEKQEVVNQFVKDIDEIVKTNAKNNVWKQSTVYFLVSDKEGNCEVVKRVVPPTIIPKSPEDLLQLVFLKFYWKTMLDEIKNEYDELIHFIQTERLDYNDRSILTFMRRDGDGTVIPKMYEIKENDIIVSSDGEMRPMSIDLVPVDIDMSDIDMD